MEIHIPQKRFIFFICLLDREQFIVPAALLNDYHQKVKTILVFPF